MKLKFFERVVLDGIKEFQELNTEDKKRYITLYGHYHFSQWFAGLAVQPLVGITLSVTTLILAVLNMAMIFVEERAIYMTVFFVSFPFMALFTYILRRMTKVWKMEQNQFKEWYEKATDKIQNLIFKDFKIFSIWKRMYVRKIDKIFYDFLLRIECRGKCYECSFKLAKMWKDSKVKILWIAASGIGVDHRYGHAVIKRNGFILDTNTRKCYNKDAYLKAQQAEIFYEYSLEEYLQVDSPWELKWEEFGEWCEERNVQRNN